VPVELLPACCLAQTTFVPSRKAEPQFPLRGTSEISLAFEHALPRFLQDRLVAILHEPASLGGTHIIKGFVKSIENIHRVGSTLTDDPQVRLPHAEQTNLMLSDNGSPMRVKNCSKLSIVRSLPIHNSRVHTFTNLWLFAEKPLSFIMDQNECGVRV
jgi:hypothetical protein